MRTNVLIIGSGIAGLSTALYISELEPSCNILIISKSEIHDNNTCLAQGGIAAVFNHNNDSFESHIFDTLEAGNFKNNLEITKTVINQAPSIIHDLERWGVKFDQDDNGQYDLGKEGGHQHHRIVHCHDESGREILFKLIKQIKARPNINILTCHQLIELIKDDKRNVCNGAILYNLNKNLVFNIYSNITILATGGCGQLFPQTTNNLNSYGDGIAIAHKIGAEICQMNFIQFHPTVLYEPYSNPSELISEAIRGYGAYIVNSDGYRFLFDYDQRGELATRDILAYSIFDYMSNHQINHVYMDFRHLNILDLSKRFPNILGSLRTKGYNPEIDLVPIIPAAHYQCGGIKVNINSKTSIQQLYAIGECAYTGLHGTNRLASNSLLEGIVFAKLAAKSILSDSKNISNIDKVDIHYYFSIEKLDLKHDRDQLKSIMQSYYFNQYDEFSLLNMKNLILIIQEKYNQIKNNYNPDLLCLINSISCSLIIIEHALIHIRTKVHVHQTN